MNEHDLSEGLKALVRAKTPSYWSFKPAGEYIRMSGALDLPLRGKGLHFAGRHPPE